MKNIIFLFSLPRSGSTLLQRILMTHKEIYSVSEPWLLLPLVYMRKVDKNGGNGEYNSKVASVAINELVKELPEKESDYNEVTASYVWNFYDKILKGRDIYFLDKTPRYYYIIPQIVQMFPNAKFIFLFRNPLSILSSVINTWQKRWRIFGFGENHKDIYEGPELLIKGYELLKEKSMVINYEELVRNPMKEIEKIGEYLEIDFSENEMKLFKKSKLENLLGDQNIEKYNTISNQSIDKWKKTFSSRKNNNLAKKYITSIPEEVLRSMGYNKKELLRELKIAKNPFRLF